MQGSTQSAKENIFDLHDLLHKKKPENQERGSGPPLPGLEHGLNRIERVKKWSDRLANMSGSEVPRCVHPEGLKNWYSSGEGAGTPMYPQLWYAPRARADHCV